MHTSPHVKVESVHFPEQFRNDRRIDFGLIRLKKEINYPELHAIKMPKRNHVRETGKVVFAGWGETPKKRISDVLLKVDLFLRIPHDCKRIYGSYFHSR